MQEIRTNPLTEEEYFQLSRLFNEFKLLPQDSVPSAEKQNIVDAIGEYIYLFHPDSKVRHYFGNWSKLNIHSDAYMPLILNLERFSDSLSEKKYFNRLLSI